MLSPNPQMTRRPQVEGRYAVRADEQLKPQTLMNITCSRASGPAERPGYRECGEWKVQQPGPVLTATTFAEAQPAEGVAVTHT